MADDKIAHEIRRLVAKIVKLPEDKVTLEANLFDDLGVDSLLGVEIFSSLDKKYGINVPEAKLANLTSVNDLVKLVNELKLKNNFI